MDTEQERLTVDDRRRHLKQMAVRYRVADRAHLSHWVSKGALDRGPRVYRGASHLSTTGEFRRRASCRGEDTINGSGIYGSKITAIDAENTPSTDHDLCRSRTMTSSASGSGTSPTTPP